MAPRHRGNVLLVDDDHGIREIVAEALSTAGYQVCAVTNGKEALACIRESDPPDVVLLDLVMPVTSGFEVINAYRLDPSLTAIPLIVMSASSTALTTSDDYHLPTLRKPFTLDQLLDEVGRHCRSA